MTLDVGVVRLSPTLSIDMTEIINLNLKIF